MFGKECLAESQGDILCLYTGKEKGPFTVPISGSLGMALWKSYSLGWQKRITSRNHSHKSLHVGAPCMNMAPQRWPRMSLHRVLGTTVCIYICIEVGTWKQGLCISKMIRSRKANMWEKLIKDKRWLVNVCFVELSCVAMWLIEVHPSWQRDQDDSSSSCTWSFSSQLMQNSPSL